MRFATVAIVLLLLMARAAIAEETPAAKEYSALLAEFEEEGGVRQFAGRFLEFAEKHAQDPAAADALFWVVENVRGRRETVQAIALLERHHLQSERMGAGCSALARSRTVGAEKLLRGTLAANKHKPVQAQACFYLAQHLDREAIIVEQIRANPELAPRVLQYYGKEYGDHLASLDPVELSKQREAAYAQLLQTFAGEKVEGQDVAEVAKKALHAIRNLSVGRVAPEIKGVDIGGERFALSDYRGKVVMLSFWGHW